MKTNQGKTMALALSVLLVLSILPGGLEAGCSATTNTGLVAFWRAWQSDWDPDVEDTVIDAFAHFGITTSSGKLIVRREWDLYTAPHVTLSNVTTHLNNKRSLVLSTHGGDPDFAGAGIAVEYHSTYEAADAAAEAYDSQGFTYGLNPYYCHIMLGQVDDGFTTAHVITLTNLGIADHWNGLLHDVDAFVYGDYCYSKYTFCDYAEPGRGWDVATFMGYETHPDDACGKMETVFHRLGCGSWWYGIGHQTDDAIRYLTYIKLWGDNRKNQLYCGDGCVNILALFKAAGAFDDVVWWRTQSEIDSKEFLVRSYDDRYGEPDTLARVPAVGGYGIEQQYTFSSGGSYAYYDVVERDTHGGETYTSLLQSSSRPDNWEQWLANPRVDYDVLKKEHRPRPLMERIDGMLVPFGSGQTLVSMPPAGPPPPPPDDTDCADVVIYSSINDLINPVANHVTSEGIKVRSFVGSTDPDDATLAFDEVRQANISYNMECDTYPPGCDHFYSEHPLLIIVGDSNHDRLVVGHKEFPDADGRCLNLKCVSDFDITDTDGDGRPEGPVTRIPAETVEEVQRAVAAAQDFNSGNNVDRDYHLITLAGNYHTGGYQTAVDVMGEVQDVYLSKGHLLRPMLMESDYGSEAARMAAAEEQVNAGAFELWGFGYNTSSAWWPGNFIRWDNIENLETPQRLLAWIPNCVVAAVWQGEDFMPTISEVLSFRDPDSTTLAGFVGHLTGGHDHQHEDFARILLAERESAAPGTPVARVVYDAVRDAQQNGWLFDYARSVGVLGGYVKLPGYLCGAGNLSCDVICPDGGETWDRGTEKEIEWRVCFDPGWQEQLRKHSIHLTRNDGTTWHTISDSVEATARTYDWRINALASDHCRIRIISHVDSLDEGQGRWVPAYACTCMSEGTFSIKGGSGQPCPHLYVWRDSHYDLVNSVLRRENTLRQPVDDHLVIRRPQQDDGMIRFRINQVEPDTTYLYSAAITPLPEAGNVVVTAEGGLFRLGQVIVPTGVIDGGTDALEKITLLDEQYFVGAAGSCIGLTFSGLSAEEAVLLVNVMMKKPPQQPLNQEGSPPPGLELSMDGTAGFIADGDTVASVVLSPREFPSTVALLIVGMDPADETLAIRVNWNSEHHVDCISLAPEPVRYVSEIQPQVPVTVEYLSSGEPFGKGEGMFRLVPDDILTLIFKTDGGLDTQNAAYLLSLTGYFVGPEVSAGIRPTHELSLSLASPTPVTGARLSGKFSVPHATQIELDVYDVRGRLVKRIHRGHAEPGVHSFGWGLGDNSGSRVAPGLYFLRLHTAKRSIVQKVVVEY